MVEDAVNHEGRSTSVLVKVTAFLIRPSPAGGDPLLFCHPYAGIQIPAEEMWEN